jgi:hypothetical protein
MLKAKKGQFIMWPTGAELKSLSEILRLRMRGDEQDWELQEWEWDYADPQRVDEFLDIYEQQNLSENQRMALMALIVESYNSYLAEHEHIPILWERIEKHLKESPEIHEYAITYWLLAEDADKSKFSIGNQIRKIFDLKSSNAT